MTINTEKSEAICFTRKSISRCQPLSLEGRPIAYKESVKYLGVRLDRRLCFNAHVTETLAKARGVRAKIYPYLACRSPLALRTKVTLYLLFLRSVLTYAAPVWWSLVSATNRRRLESFQSRTLRSLSGSPWFVRNSVIRGGLRVPALSAFVWSLAATLFAAAETSSFPYLRTISTTQPPPPVRVKRPRAILDDPP